MLKLLSTIEVRSDSRALYLDVDAARRTYSSSRDMLRHPTSRTSIWNDLKQIQSLPLLSCYVIYDLEMCPHLIRLIRPTIPTTIDLKTNRRVVKLEYLSLLYVVRLRPVLAPKQHWNVVEHCQSGHSYGSHNAPI